MILGIFQVRTEKVIGLIHYDIASWPESLLAFWCFFSVYNFHNGRGSAHAWDEEKDHILRPLWFWFNVILLSVKII